MDIVDTSKKKTALNNLKKFDSAKKIIKTTKGAIAIEKCD